MAKEKAPKYCLSLWQPWAMLWALGEKQFETRHWDLPESMIGQEVFIHAAQRWTESERWLCSMPIFREAFLRHSEIVGENVDDQIGVTYRMVDVGQGQYIKFPFGCLVGRVRLVRSVSTNAPQSFFNLTANPAKERAFGNYDPDRFAWIGEKHKVLPQFIPLIGNQRFFRAPVQPEALEVQHA